MLKLYGESNLRERRALSFIERSVILCPYITVLNYVNCFTCGSHVQLENVH